MNVSEVLNYGSLITVCQPHPYIGPPSFSMYIETVLGEPGDKATSECFTVL